MSHLPLPDLDDEPVLQQVTDTENSIAEKPEAVPSRSAWSVGGLFAYMIHLSQKNTGLCGVTVMISPVSFTKEQLDEKVSVAAKITNEACLGERRKRMNKQQVRIENPNQLNETWFASDMEFFEGVMMDKFQFQQLKALNARAEIEPTINLK